MKSVLVSAALFAGAMAGVCYAPVPTASETQPEPSAAPAPAPGPGYFGVISARSASPIHLQTLTARGGKFYLGGGPPSSYCPPNVADACPPGNTTVLAGGDNTLSLGVVVPGGQQVYIAPDGSLSYTQPHSVFMPEGSIQTGFSRTAPVNDQAFGYLNYGAGFVACPPAAANATEGYQVYGATTNATTFGPECLGFSALSVSVDEAGAWEY
jgi:hypothetical protein